MRIGQGYDAHRFQAGTEVILGGVTIPFEQSLAAHSDGDVLLHAICDAVLGAAALGDIGRHFPDTSAAFKGADSRALLREVVRMVLEKGLQIENVDATVIAERPKISPFVEAMRHNLADDLGISIDRINVKGTTTEKMGFTGRGEGIAATAVALLS
ncbi:MAG: 2-C-methyl-D-erythritol 2,4-cyclodiphosphate synthase [Gammaproteobacteria bacterium]|jgi:2-C-methyl-D-erythritol 2,4-cyclodiphosphate synthase